MGKLIIFLAFSLGALLMLESVQASKDCRSYGVKGFIYIMKMTKPGKDYDQWYKIGASVNPDTRLKNLQTGNPNKLQLVKKFHVSDCKKAEDAIKVELKDTLKFGKGDGGSEWLRVKNPFEMISLAAAIEGVTKHYSIHITKAMAEGDDDDSTMNDGENSRLHLQELLLRLLD